MTMARKTVSPALATALVALLFAGNALNYVDRQVVALLKPTLQAAFHWSDGDFAHLGAAFQFAAAGALVFVGWFIDRLGVRLGYGLAVLVWSLAGIAHAVAATVQQFVAARIVLGIGETVSTPAAVKAATLYLTVKQRNQALGVINTAPNLGAILTPLIIPPFAVAFGWQAAFLVTGGLGLIWLAAWWWGTRTLGAVDAAVARQPVDWRLMLRQRSTWTVIGAKFWTDGVWWFVLFWMPDYFHRVFGMSQTSLGRPIALVFVLAAAGALSAGSFYPWLVACGVPAAAARKRSMLVFALVVLAMPLALLVHNVWIAALLIGLGLFAHQGFSTNIFSMATDIVPAQRMASVIALGAVAGNLAGVAVIELAGWSLGHGHGYAPMFVYCGMAYLVALGWIQIVMPRLTRAE